jgi:hypothetical protein
MSSWNSAPIARERSRHKKKLLVRVLGVGRFGKSSRRAAPYYVSAPGT